MAMARMVTAAAIRVLTVVLPMAALLTVVLLTVVAILMVAASPTAAVIQCPRLPQALLRHRLPSNKLIA